MRARTVGILWMVYQILTGVAAQATTYVVAPDGSGDFPTIQAAVDAVVNGDVIELTAGTFSGPGNRDISFLGKAITIRSQSGHAEDCIVDAGGMPGNEHRGFLFVSGEGPGSVLAAVTITGGYVGFPGFYAKGGGILCEGGSPTIQGCIFTENHATGYGGGLCCHDYASPQILDCLFEANVSEAYGGGLAIVVASPQVERCVFRDNGASERGGGVLFHCIGGGPTASFVDCTFIGNVAAWTGGGFSTASIAHATLTGCTFHNNRASVGGGLYCGGGSGLTLERTIVAFSAVGSAIHAEEPGDVLLNCCDLYGNAGGDWIGYLINQYGQNGNIGLDPLFCDRHAGDVRLQEASPCAPFSAPNPECDLIGAWPAACPSQEYVCCLGNECRILGPDDCYALGGEWRPGLESCSPNPCGTYACCVGEDCSVVGYEECDLLGGVWLEGTLACEPGTCPAYACCAGEVCELTPESVCADAGGEWKVGFPTCAPNPCEGGIYLIEPDGTGHFPTIRAALDMVLWGDVIELADGTFTGEGNRDLDFHGKEITVRSQGRDATQCVIDCEGQGRGFHFHSGETISSCVRAVTIRSGAASTGGGVYCEEASPRLIDCIIEDCTAGIGGAVACVSDASPLLVDCTLAFNEASDRGGGLFCLASASPELIGCTITHNSAVLSGGGIFLMHYVSPRLERCIVSFSPNGEAIACTGSAVNPSLTCCDLYGNAGGDWVGSIAGQYGVNGNIAEDPLFCDALGRNFRLEVGSPCAPWSPPNPECDLIGAWPVGCDPAAVTDTPLPAFALLGRPRPNPFTGATVMPLSFAAGVQEPVRVAVFDLAGRQIRMWSVSPLTCGEGARNAGRLTWDGRDEAGRSVAAGIYYFGCPGVPGAVRRPVLLVR